MRRPNIMSWRAKVVTIIMLCSFLLLPVLVVSKISMGSTVEGLYINEVMSSNATTLSDADGAYSDWIELYNAGEEQVDVSGFYLSDDTTKKTKWTFPAQTTIPAKGFLLVWASSSDSSVGTNGELHTNFSIKAGGEPIVLTMPDGVTVIDQLGAQALKDDESYGRYPDGSSQWTTYTKGSATPNASNPDPNPVPATPIFSQPGGFYVNEFSLVISSNEPDVTIYYTLDGSKPDPANTVTAGKYNIKQDYSGSELLEREKRTYQYSEPLSINRQALDSNSLSYIRTTHSQVPSDRSWKEPSLDNGKAVVVRAIAYRNGVASPCITQTYFIGSEWQNLSLPVVSIIMDPADLFDYENGLYVPGKMFDDSANYSGVWNTWPANYETDWEKPAYVEFYESNGNLGFAQNIGVRMHGEWTRAYPYKSLRLYAKSDYDTKSTFAYDVFPGAKNNNNEDLDHYKRLILKNGGQSFYNTMLPDAIMQSSFNGLGKVDLQYYRPAIEFINGEYWGITNVQERLDKYYLKYHYGVNEDNVAIIEGPYARVEDLVEGDETDCSNYISMRDYAEEKDIRLAENYQHLQSLMDVDSYIDYNVLRIYSGDVDSVTKHMYAWREKNGSGVTDGKWRWQTKDFDGSMAAYDVNRDLLAVSLDPNLSDATILFRKLVTNDDFKNQFINRFADHLNTTFVPSRMETIINQMSSEVSSEIVKHISRWGYPASLNNWTYTVNSYKTWAQERPAIQRQQIVNQFGLAGTYALTLHTDGAKGTIKINSMEINQNTPGVIDPNNWTGVYFQGVPIQLQVIPQPGYRFTGWTGVDSMVDDTTKNQITLMPGSDIIVAASFEKETVQDNCFIATAAFGSKFAPAVSLLRKFRDDFLMNSDWGRRFVNFYYKNSPPIARFIAKNEMLRLMVRILLMPLIVFVYMLYRPFYVIAVLLVILFFYMIKNKYRVRRTSN